MKVKVLTPFIDKHTGQAYEPNQTLDLEKSRVDEIMAKDNSLIKKVVVKKAKKDE